MHIKHFIVPILVSMMFSGCKKTVVNIECPKPDARIVFLHHSTGRNIWYGDIEQNRRISFVKDTCMVPRIINDYYRNQGLCVNIEEQNFPSGKAYPWENYPYDYYNIWVKNAGNTPFQGEPTLEILTRTYDIIIFKHCFPVSRILPSDNHPDVDSPLKTIENYKLQYLALRDKLHEFPQNRFIVWTGAALLENQTTPDDAKRAKDFFTWVVNEWDIPGDNIVIFDFREIETQGGLYLQSDFAAAPDDSHPNMEISKVAAKELSQCIIKTVASLN